MRPKSHRSSRSDLLENQNQVTLSLASWSLTDHLDRTYWKHLGVGDIRRLNIQSHRSSRSDLLETCSNSQRLVFRQQSNRSSRSDLLETLWLYISATSLESHRSSRSDLLETWGFCLGDWKQGLSHRSSRSDLLETCLHSSYLFLFTALLEVRNLLIVQEKMEQVKICSKITQYLAPALTF